MLFKNTEEVDALWPALKTALKDGQLGRSMKAATSPSRNGVLICIYTEDWHDIKDIRRVLASLRELAVKPNETIYYKADDQTKLGISGSIYSSHHDTEMDMTFKGKEWYAANKLPLPKL